MSLVSFNFFVFIGIAVAIYYLLPLKYRWTVLLVSSFIFYLSGGERATLLVLCIAFFSFIMAKKIEKNEKGKLKKLFLSISIVILLSILAIIKICGHYNTFVDYLIVPIGISYFSLSIIGYLLDVYWKKDFAEKNFAYFLTFIMFFPKIVQGPISRHKFLNKQLINGNAFDYNNLTLGIQLIIWGVFKKIVIADRMNILVTNVYSNLDIYAKGLVIIPTMILSALELYFDFSGYTDIAVGISQMFGIELEQNFNHPFFSRTASEFWQRWHMTLSGWFKDYLFLPVSRSSIVKKFSKKMGNKYGALARKKTMMIISTAIVWVATGLWHGTGINYMVWGLYWGLIIISSELLSSYYEKINALLHINTHTLTWKVFQVLRTSFIFVLGKMISAQKSLNDVKIVLWAVIKNTHFSDLKLLTQLGLDIYDFVIIAIGVIFLFFVSFLQEKGISIRKSIAGWNAISRWAFYSFSITVILLIGLYGVGYDTSTFAYQFF